MKQLEFIAFESPATAHSVNRKAFHCRVQAEPLKVTFLTSLLSSLAARGILEAAEKTCIGNEN